MRDDAQKTIRWVVFVIGYCALVWIASAQELEPFTPVKPIKEERQYNVAPSYAGNNIPPNSMIVNGRAVPYPNGTPTTAGAVGIPLSTGPGLVQLSNGVVPVTKTNFIGGT